MQDDLYRNTDSGLQLIKTIKYEFDEEINPFRVFACEGIPGLYTNRNNILNETITSYFGTYEESSSIQNVYEYNSIKLPVTVNGKVYKYGK